MNYSSFGFERERENERKVLPSATITKQMLYENEIAGCCRTLYPIEYRKKAELLELPGLPREILDRIQQERGLEDLIVPQTKIEELLGFGQSQWKDRLLKKIICEHMDDVTLPTKKKVDRQIILVAVYFHGEYLGRESAREFLDDKEVVMTALRTDWCIFPHVSERLRGDMDVLSHISYHNTFGCIPNSTLSNMENFKILIKQDPIGVEDDYLYSTSAEIRQYLHVHCHSMRLENREVEFSKEALLIAIERNGNHLIYGRHFRDDREVVIKAIRQNGRALQYASLRLRKDPGVVILAVRQYPRSFRFAGTEAKKKVALYAIFRDAENFKFVPPVLREENKTIAMIALTQNPALIKYIKGDLRQDEDICSFERQIKKRKLKSIEN